MEQTHFNANATNTTDFLMFVETTISSNEIQLFKLIKTENKVNLAQGNLLKDKKRVDFSLMV